MIGCSRTSSTYALRVWSLTKDRGLSLDGLSVGHTCKRRVLSLLSWNKISVWIFAWPIFSTSIILSSGTIIVGDSLQDIYCISFSSALQGLFKVIFLVIGDTRRLPYDQFHLLWYFLWRDEFWSIWLGLSPEQCLRRLWFYTESLSMLIRFKSPSNHNN